MEKLFGASPRWLGTGLWAAGRNGVCRNSEESLAEQQRSFGIIPLDLVREGGNTALRDPFGPDYKPVGSRADELERITGDQGENLGAHHLCPERLTCNCQPDNRKRELGEQADRSVPNI
jgi:hypothetical protein